MFAYIEKANIFKIAKQNMIIILQVSMLVNINWKGHKMVKESI